MTRLQILLDRVTPSAVVATWVASLCLYLPIHILVRNGWRPPLAQLDRYISLPAAIVAYGTAVALCLRIAAEHKVGSSMRFAWTSLALSAAACIVRHVVDSPLPELLAPDYRTMALSFLLLESFVAISLIFLLVGMIAVWWTFHRSGLGFKLRLGESLTILAVLLCLAGMLSLRQGMWDKRWVSTLAFGLQLSTQLLLGAVAASGTLLYQVCRQMGGGRLGKTMQWIVIYAMLRLLLYFAFLLNKLMVFSPQLGIWRFALFFCTPWIFLLASSWRSQLSVAAVRERVSGKPAIAAGMVE